MFLFTTLWRYYPTKLVIAISSCLDDLIIALQRKKLLSELGLVGWNRDRMCHVRYTSCIQIASLTHDKTL